MKLISVFFGAALSILPLTTNAQGTDPSRACLERVRDSSSSLKVLEGKFVFDVSKGQPIEVLTNPSRPNAQEKVALGALATEVEYCVAAGADWRAANYPPQINAVIAQAQTESLEILADLYEGNLTYGQAAKRRAQRFSELQARIADIAADVQAQRLAAQQSAQAARQREIASEEEAKRTEILRRLANRPTYSAPGPSMTHCYTIGNMTDCSTH